MLVKPGPGDWADGGTQAEDAFVTARLTDDGVSVSFSKSQSRDFPDSETFEPLVAHCRQCGALDAACGCHAHGVQA